MTTIDTPINGTTTLAVREFSDKQIRTRLEAASKPGFGMEKATRDQLNMVYLLAKHYDVDPAVDITLFQGRPFFTIDGRVRLMKRHPQYAGYRVRPLPKDEKEAWGYREDEIVVECSIRTREWGEITARGKVSPDEFRRQPVAASHPQEMAEKRAIARASRMAFGQDVPDEDATGFVIEERNDPVRTKALAADYTRIFGTEDDADHVRAVVPAEDEQAFVPMREQDVEDGEETPWQRNRRLVARAQELGLQGMPTLSGRAKPDAITEANAVLAERIENAEIDARLTEERDR